MSTKRLQRSQNPSPIRAVSMSLLSLVQVVIYIQLFLFFYKTFLVPNYEYQGFVFQIDSIYTLLVAIIWAAAPSLIMPYQIGRPSAFVSWLLYLIVYIPSQIILTFVVEDLQGQLLAYRATLALGMFFLALSPRLPPIQVPNLKLPSWFFNIALLMFAVISYAYLFKVFGLQSFVTNLTDVYKVRLEARETIEAAGRIAGYLLRWLGSVINSYFIIRGLVYRSPVFFLGIIGQLLIFSFDATKATLGSILLIVLIYFLFRHRAKICACSLSLVFSVAFVASMAFDFITQSASLTGLFFRRVFAVPGLLTGFYYEYFSSNPHFYWLHTTYAKILGLSNLTNYPDYKGPGFLIGELFFRNPQGNANANLWADGFANAGLAGVVLVSLVLALYLWLYDSVASRKSKIIAYAIIAMPAFAVTNTSLLTSLLTHGLLVALFFMWLLPNEPQGDIANAEYARYKHGNASN